MESLSLAFNNFGIQVVGLNDSTLVCDSCFLRCDSWFDFIGCCLRGSLLCMQDIFCCLGQLNLNLLCSDCACGIGNVTQLMICEFILTNNVNDTFNRLRNVKKESNDFNKISIA